MSTVTTAGAWVRLALGADDPARADEPGSAALFAVIASNATRAAREGELRVLWERGPFEVYADCATTDDPRTLRWSATEGDGVLACFAGRHRVRLFGETQQAPTITLAVRAAAPATETVGVVLIVQPTFGAPDPLAAMQAVARTRSTSLTRLAATIALTPEALAQHSFAPSTGSGTPSSVDEQGTMTEVSIFVGAWCTSGSAGAKAALGGMTVYLGSPL